VKKLSDSTKLPDVKVVDDGEFWKVPISEPGEGRKIIAKKVATEKNPDVRVDVGLEIKKDGERKLDVFVSSVYYPKSRYYKVDVESQLSHIMEKALDPKCPLCERYRAALSVKPREDFFDQTGFPKIDFPTPNDIFGDTVKGVETAIEDTIEGFKLLMPPLPFLQSFDKRKP